MVYRAVNRLDIAAHDLVESSIKRIEDRNTQLERPGNPVLECRAQTGSRSGRFQGYGRFAST